MARGRCVCGGGMGAGVRYCMMFGSRLWSFVVAVASPAHPGPQPGAVRRPGTAACVVVAGDARGHRRRPGADVASGAGVAALLAAWPRLLRGAVARAAYLVARLPPLAQQATARVLVSGHSSTSASVCDHAVKPKAIVFYMAFSRSSRPGPTRRPATFASMAMRSRCDIRLRSVGDAARRRLRRGFPPNPRWRAADKIAGAFMTLGGKLVLSR